MHLITFKLALQCILHSMDQCSGCVYTGPRHNKTCTQHNIHIKANTTHSYLRLTGTYNPLVHRLIKHIYIYILLGNRGGGSKTHSKFRRGGGFKILDEFDGGSNILCNFRRQGFLCVKNGNPLSPAYVFDLSLIYTLCPNFIPV